VGRGDLSEFSGGGGVRKGTTWEGLLGKGENFRPLTICRPQFRFIGIRGLKGPFGVRADLKQGKGKTRKGKEKKKKRKQSNALKATPLMLKERKKLNDEKRSNRTIPEPRSRKKVRRRRLRRDSGEKKVNSSAERRYEKPAIQMDQRGGRK